MRTEPSIAIVGSGFSGLGLAIRLKQAGFTDITVFEKGDDVGGVWRDNSYPGAACDAPSHLYSYSFAPNPGWSRRFAEQQEIFDYLRACARRYDIYRHIEFGREVTHATYDTGDGRWYLVTDDGEIHPADLLVSACGQLSVPSYPPIPGLEEEFQGTVFHSARWRHDHHLRDRNVAVIGNGASAIQFVPHIARQAAQVTIFQQQSQWISPKPDRAYPAWRKALNRAFPLAQRLPRLGIFLWFETILNPMLVSRRGRKLLSFPLRAICRLNLRRIADPALRARLTPDYELGCTRILTSSEYYETLNRPNTTVVTSPISHITTDALITGDGVKHRADTIILATGFRSHDFVAPMKVTGSGGLDLTEAWQKRPRAFLGMAVPGFPNFFLMYGPNTNVGSGSIVHMLESQMTYLLQAAHHIAAGRTLDLKPQVLDAYDSRTQDRLEHTVWNQGGCHSWYLTDGERPKNTNNWPGSMRAYRRLTSRLDLAHYQAT